MIDKTVLISGNPGLAMGQAMALLLAAKSHKRRVATVAPTPEQLARQKARDERAAWNAEVEARKAEKRSRKAIR